MASPKRHMVLDGSQVRTLQELGGFASFLANRCLYLSQHPDGAPGQDVNMDDQAYQLLALVEGAVIDLFGEIPRNGGKDPIAKVDLAGQAGISVRLTLGRTGEPKGAGSLLLRALARRWEIERATEQGFLVFEIDSSSLRQGFEQLPPSSGSCPPVVGPQA